MRTSPLVKTSQKKKNIVNNKDIFQWMFLPTGRALTYKNPNRRNYHTLHLKGLLSVLRPRDAAKLYRSKKNTRERKHVPKLMLDRRHEENITLETRT